MTTRVSNGLVLVLLFSCLAVGSFTWLVTDQCGGSGSARGFVSNAAAWFTTEGCGPPGG